MVGHPKIGRNDPCPCGSGRKYKHCCLGGPIGDRTVAAERSVDPSLSLDERNAILLEAIIDIFKLDKRDWDDVRRDISDDKVRQLYKVMARVWPPNTPIETALPQPDAKLRALYLGVTDPTLILENIVRYALYCDEILVVNPLFNPWTMRAEYDPIRNPAQYRSDVLKLVAFIFTLVPWINSGIVRLIPNPGDIEPDLRFQTWSLAGERMKNQGPSEEDFEEARPFMLAELARALWRSPDEYLESMAKQAIPGITESEMKTLLAEITERRSRDPLGLVEQKKGAGSEIIAFRTGANLELGLFICQATGAFPYTNLRFRWRELLSVSRELPGEGNVWTPLTRAFQGLEFKFLNQVDHKFAVSLHEDGRLEQFRSFLRRIWQSIPSIETAKIESTVRQFSDELKDEYRKAQAEWSRIDQELLKWVGAGLITGQMIAGIPAAGFAISGVVALLNAHMKRRAFMQRVPMSVFINLSHKR
jgi:hypothetical protein